MTGNVCKWWKRRHCPANWEGGSVSCTGRGRAPTEVVVEVEVYHPTRSSRQEAFKVLGSQPLLALRRAIYCVTARAGTFRGGGGTCTSMCGRAGHHFRDVIVSVS